MKNFSDSFINLLNSRYGSASGVFFKSAVLSVTDADTRYFADLQQPIVIDGHTYTPLPMSWSGVQQRSDMPVLAVRVTVPNINGQVGAFLETTSLRNRSVTLSIMHMDLLGVANARETINLKVLMSMWRTDTATFVAGMGLLLSEHLPSQVIQRKDFPGCPDLLRRGSIL